MTKFKEGDIVIGTNPGFWAHSKPYKIHEVNNQWGSTHYVLYDMETKKVMGSTYWGDTELELVFKTWKKRYEDKK